MMRSHAAGICFGILLAAAGVQAQNAPQVMPVSSTQPVASSTSPDYTAINCSSFVSADKVPDEIRLISGEESKSKVIFATRNIVYISKGSAQGVHVGDRFSAVRPVTDADRVQWFQWQDKLMKAMGTVYKDTGQLRVINVGPNVSTAEVTFTCDYMQRGDILRPYVERPSPPFKPIEQFDTFAPVSGKPVGMLVVGQEFTQLYGKNSIVYVNLGNSQGVKIGDYVRVFRYQGTLSETAPQERDFQYKLFGFGSTPQRYTWKDLPREILGEGIVINTSKNSASVYLTYSKIEMYAGDYAEIE